jgi:hypothetical protein
MGKKQRNKKLRPAIEWNARFKQSKASACRELCRQSVDRYEQPYHNDMTQSTTYSSTSVRSNMCLHISRKTGMNSGGLALTYFKHKSKVMWRHVWNKLES